MISKWFQTTPEESECLRELCRRLCGHFGTHSISQPLMDLGMALTRAKCVASGLAYEGLHMTVYDTMLPGLHIKGMRQLVEEADSDFCNLLIRECEVGEACLMEAMWSPDLQNLEEDLANDAHAVFLEANLVIQDVCDMAKYKRDAICPPSASQ